MEITTFDESSTRTSIQLSDITYEPDITQEASEKVCQTLYKARKYMVYEDNLLQLFRTCPACCHTCTVEKFVNGIFVSITQVLSALCLECMCPRTFLLESSRHSGKAVVLGGDMRADSTGLAKKMMH